ncbi:MAG: hypothetical protein FWB74_03620 [Defluviitaleaceae bacterium]|nr:hypothetical protein [Defluviitaleaceae bacterium]
MTAKEIYEIAVEAVEELVQKDINKGIRSVNRASARHAGNPAALQKMQELLDSELTEENINAEKADIMEGMVEVYQENLAKMQRKRRRDPDEERELAEAIELMKEYVRRHS